MLNLHYKPVTNPSQTLVHDLTGSTELGLCEFIEISPGRGDKDECYRVSTTRRFQIDGQHDTFSDMQEWYEDEFIGFALLGCNRVDPDPDFDTYYDSRN